MARSDERVSEELEVQGGIAADSGDAIPPAVSVISGLFQDDRKDAVLLGFFTGIVKLYETRSGAGDPTICDPFSLYVLCFAYLFIIGLYGYLHFRPNPKTHRPMSERVLRFVVFCLFNLCVHQEPLSCFLPRDDPPADSKLRPWQISSPYSGNLAFLQAVVLTGLGVIVNAFLSEDKADVTDGNPEKKKN